MVVVMLMLVLAVIATAAGVLYWFFRHLRRIEAELWGSKRKEAADTALAETVHEQEPETSRRDKGTPSP